MFDTADERQMQSTHWLLKKEVTLGVIISLFIQSASVVWYASKLDSRITTFESTTIALQKSDETISRVLETNRQFHIDQRTRMWDRLLIAEGNVQRIVSDQKTVYAHIDNINKNIDRLLNKIDNLQRNNQSPFSGSRTNVEPN